MAGETALDPTQLASILQRKANELVTRKIDTPKKEEQHLVLHWTNGQGFSIDFNLTLSLRTAKMESLIAVINECRKELLQRGLASSAR